MKKFTISIVALAAMVITSCGGGKSQQEASDVDSTKSFEQEQVEAAIKMHIDSLVANMNDKDVVSISDRFENGQVKLTAEDKKVKPDYLLAATTADEATTIAQKYTALSMLMIDQKVAAAYDMDTADYNAAISKLITEINDPALNKAQELDGDLKAKSDLLYKEMSDEGRINFYWIGSAAFMVEDLYILSQNAEKFLEGYTDDQVAAITFRIVCILDAIDRLSVYDPQIPGIADALTPLKDINAITVEDFKKELVASKEKLAASRQDMLK